MLGLGEQLLRVDHDLLAGAGVPLGQAVSPQASGGQRVEASLRLDLPILILEDQPAAGTVGADHEPAEPGPGHSGGGSVSAGVRDWPCPADRRRPAADRGGGWMGSAAGDAEPVKAAGMTRTISSP